MADYNVSLGKGKDAQSISLNNDMKGGVKKDDIKDEKMKSIFSMLDANNNGILENSEIDVINDKIYSFAQKCGKGDNLSKKEAKQLIANLGLKGIKANDLFKFLSTVKSAASNIVSQTVDTDGSKAIDVEYKADDNGNKVTKQYDSKTGNLTGSYTVDKDGNEFWQDADGKVTKGKDDVGNYTRKYNDDGSYIDTYKDGRIRNYDTNGRWVSGTTTNGITYAYEYNEDGSFTATYSNGIVQEYDKNNRLLGGKLPNGKTCTNEYHEDGSYTKTYSNGEVQEYDKNNRKLSGTLPDGMTWTSKYNEDGSFTRTFSDGEVQEYDKNNRLLGGKLPNGTTFEAKYNKQGELKYKEFSRKDGSKYYWSADDKSSAEKTANGNLKVNPKQGETFDQTMERLGITDPADKELFIKSNLKAYKRGYFLLASGEVSGDVYIPKAIADKLDINNVLVDEAAEFEKHKQARKTPSMGI